MKNIYALLFICLITGELMAQFIYAGNLTEPRSSLDAVSRNGKVYFIGGQKSQPVVRLSYMDVYDEEKNTWTKPQQDQPIFWPAIVAGDSGVYVIGGITSTEITRRSVVYKDDETWHEIDSIEDPQFIAKAIKVGSKIIVGGGVQESNGSVGRPHTDKIYIYDEASGKWSTKTLSQKRFLYAMATDGISKVYFAGGFMGDFSDSVSDRVDIYDVDSDTWDTTSLAIGRGNLAGAYLNGKFFFAGGFYRESNGNWTESDVLDIFDGTSRNSTNKLVEARGFLNAAVLHNEVLFYAGGFGYNDFDATSYSGAIDIWDDQNGNWKTQVTDGRVRCYFPMAATEKYVYTAGGYDGSKYWSEVDVYSKYLGTEEIFAKRTYKIYPNPAADYIKVDGIEKDSPCQLMDQMGKMLVNTTLSSNNNSIDVRQLPEGIYFLKINDRVERVIIE